MKPVVIGNATGIYAISNKVTGKEYIGSAVNLRCRWNQHVHKLKTGNHSSPKLQASWDKHGHENFIFRPIEMVSDRNDLIAREQHWLDVTQAHRTGYNILPKAGSRLGIKHSAKTRAKMKASQKQRIRNPCSEETKRKISEAQKGIPKPPCTDEYRLNMSICMKGRKKPPRTQEARLAAAIKQTGKVRSAETRAKMTASQKARWEKIRASK